MKKGIFIVVFLCFYMKFMRILCRKLGIILLTSHSEHFRSINTKAIHFCIPHPFIDIKA